MTDAPDYSYSSLNGITRAADGTITYDFDGKVHAQGVVLPAANLVSNAPRENVVEWERESDGALMARIVGTTSGEISMRSNIAAVGRGAGLFTTDDTTGKFVELRGERVGTVMRAQVETAAFTRTLLDDNGASSFVQLTSTRKVTLHGPWVENASLPAGPSGANGATINVGSALATGLYVVCGYISGSNTVTWGVVAATSNTLQFTYGNWYAGAGQSFSLGFFVVSFG